MPTSYTSLIGLALPVTGELSGTWGDTVNNYITNYLDSAVAGTQTISGTQTAVTLSVTNGSSLVTAGSGATGSAQFQIINCTGNPAGLLTITAPASSRQYIIINATSTSQSVKIVGTGPTTGVTILSGEKAHVAWNGSDFVKIATQSGNGSFVDLTVSGSLTLSGGTANGVLYLNGSKVATSGSALTFDGTNLVNLGGTVRAQAASTQDALQIQGRAGGTSSFITTLTPGTLTASNTLTLPIGTTTLAGLGTAQTFSATQTFSAAVTMSATTQNIALGTSQTTGTFTVGGASQTGTQTFDQSTKAHTLNIGTGATENATTKTINLGTAGVSGSTTTINIGSAVSGATNSITINGNPTFSGGTANGVLYLNGSKVATSGSALTFDGSQLVIDSLGDQLKLTRTTVGSGTLNIGGSGELAYASGFHIWFNAAKSTEWMRLDSSGNLGIGTTSPGAKLDVSSAGVVAARIYNTASSSDAYLICKNTSGESFFGVNATGPYIYTATAQAMTFLTNNAERARITSEGYLLVGTTAPSVDARLVVNNPDNVSGDFCFVTLLGSNCNNTSSYHYIASTGGSDKLYIYGNGNIVNINNSYGTLSDAKMKTDIVDAGSQWADIKAVRFRKFKMKDDPQQIVQLGVVAQELEQTSPGLVDEHADRDAEGNDLGTTTKSVKTSVLLMKAAVALQEAMARIEQLEAKVAALESKGV